MTKQLLNRLWRLIPPGIHWRLMWLIQPKFNVGVAGLIYDAAGRVLLLKHVMRRTMPWGLPSGYVQPGETVAACLEREVHEETGLTVHVDGVVSLLSGFKLRMEVVLRGKARDVGPLQLSHEVFEAAFFDADSLPDGVSSAHRRLIVEATQRGGPSAPIY